jgi:hypothetical protein
VWDQVTIVATDHAGGFIVQGGFPAGSSKVARRQQAGLNAGSQFKVTFQGARFGRRQAVEAHAGEGIGEHALRLKSAMANLTYAEGASLNPLQGLIHLLQKLEQVGGLSTGHYGFKLLAAKKKLLAQQVEISNLNCHEKASLQQNPKQRDRMQNLWRPQVIARRLSR